MFDLSLASVPGLPAGDWTTWPADELARQYDARATVADFPAEMRAYADSSRPMYALPNCRAALAYGDHPDEVLDLFPVPGRPDAPLFVFIHGGYWRALSVRESVGMAEALNRQGVAVASLNYSLAPQARLGTLVDQCRRALQWLHAHGPTHGVATRRVVVSGSSAGGHLAAMLLADDWRTRSGLPEGWLHAGVLLSGLFDLAPVRQTTPNEWLQLDANDVAQLSPIHHLPSATTPIALVVADADTPGFKQQSLDYARACAARGVAIELHDVAGRNHFDLVLDWRDADSVLSRLTRAFL